MPIEKRFIPGKLRRIVRACLAGALFLAAGTAGAQTPTPSFTHPGVLLSAQQLNFLKAQIAAKTGPIYTAYQEVIKGPYGNLKYKIQGPPSTGIIECGSYSHPDIGCSAADMDSSVAYTQAVLAWVSPDPATAAAYAANAIKILNLYSHVTSYGDPSNKDYSNGPLQAAWDGTKWPRTAEIIRALNVGWAPADIEAFSAMLNNAILQQIKDGSNDNGNWELSMTEAMMGIAVFTENAQLLQTAVTFWNNRVPAYMYYYPIDGGAPVPPPHGGKLNWNGQKVFEAATSGVTQETCRDLGHTQFGIASAINAAETAKIQGIDLYGAQRPRIEAALEFNTFYLVTSNKVPSYLCGGKLSRDKDYPTFVIAYNEYHNRLGDQLPNTFNWLNSKVLPMPQGYDAGWTHMIVEEPMTHGANAPGVD